MRALTDMVETILRRLFPTRVDFGDGSYIEFLNREAIRYAENDGRQMEVVWYFRPGSMKGRVLRVGDINHWDSPHDVEPLSAAKRKEIQQKIVAYCRRRNIPLEIREESRQSPTGY